MKFKTLVPSNDINGYLALTDDGTLVGLSFEEDWEDGGRHLTATVVPVNVVIPPSEAPTTDQAAANDTECFKGGCHKTIETWERVDGGAFHEDAPSGLCFEHARVVEFVGTFDIPNVIIGGRKR